MTEKNYNHIIELFRRGGNADGPASIVDDSDIRQAIDNLSDKVFAC